VAADEANAQRIESRYTCDWRLHMTMASFQRTSIVYAPNSRSSLTSEVFFCDDLLTIDQCSRTWFFASLFEIKKTWLFAFFEWHAKKSWADV